MKFHFILIIWVIGLNLPAQNQELLKDISLAACECLKKTNENANFEMAIGLCLLQGASPRADELRDSLGLDLSDLGNYEKLGEILAPSLMANCPEFLDRMMNAVNEGELELNEEMLDLPLDGVPDKDEVEIEWSDMEMATEMAGPEFGGPENKAFIVEEIPGTNGSGLRAPTVSGKITALRPGLISEVTLESGRKGADVYYLVNQVVGAEKLRKGRSVTLRYQESRKFHVGAGEYRIVKVITKIE